MIEFMPNLQLLQPIYLRDQPRAHFFKGPVYSVQLGGFLLKMACNLANCLVRMHFCSDC